MPRFEENVFGLVKREDLLQVGYEVERPNDPIDQLIGDTKTDNLVAYWESIASEYNIPVMAQFHAFDVEAQKTLRVPIDVHNIEKGLIKVKIDQTERLQALVDRGVTSEDALYNRVLNDGYNLAEEVFTRSKVAKNELVATGKVTIKENNLDLTIDYGVPEGNLTKTLDFGEGAAAPLDEQLLEMTAEATDKGVPLNGIYTSRTIFNRLRKDPNIQKAINGALMVGQLVRNTELEAYLNDEFGISRIYIQDGQYSLPLTQGENGRPVTHAQRYYPVDRISFFSADGNLGDGLWGDPPEVRAQKFMEVSGSEVSPYVYITQWAEHDPAVTWTKASGLFVPVIYNPNALYVATAINTPAA